MNSPVLEHMIHLYQARRLGYIGLDQNCEGYTSNNLEELGQHVSTGGSLRQRADATKLSCWVSTST